MNKQGYFELKIDKEFEQLIPPLAKYELDLLETSIVNEGCHERLVVWKGIIVDGHNRYKICKKHNLPFSYREVKFNSREEAKVWICRNQLARRNISDEVRKYLIGKRFETEKVIGAKNYHGINQYNKSSITKQPLINPITNTVEFVGEDTQTKTAERIGKEYNITHATVDKYARYSRALDKISGKCPPLAKLIMEGAIRISQENVVGISAFSKEELHVLYLKLTSYGDGAQLKDTRHEIEAAILDNDKKADSSDVEVAAIKRKPTYNPDSEVMSLFYTVPSWSKSIDTTMKKVNLNLISTEAKTKLAKVLNNLSKSANDALKQISESKGDLTAHG